MKWVDRHGLDILAESEAFLTPIGSDDSLGSFGPPLSLPEGVVSVMSATPLLSLPLPLFLLVHLYILEYPHANNAEYDHDVFNARKRGLRERAQTMEDVAYFLVGKVEGKSVKTVRRFCHRYFQFGSIYLSSFRFFRRIHVVSLLNPWHSERP